MTLTALRDSGAAPSLFSSSGTMPFDEWIETPNGRCIYRYFKVFTFRLARANLKHYSARQICGRIRWHVEVDKSIRKSSSIVERIRIADYKVNNNYTPYLARKLMAEHPEFEGFFELRELRAK